MQQQDGPAWSLGWLWLNRMLSDCFVEICDRKPGGGAAVASVGTPTQERLVLPVHAVVLCSASPLLRMLVTMNVSASRRVRGPSAGRRLPQISLGVLPGQAPAATLMLQAMYDSECLTR
jgi:hypothetical protein